MRTSIHVGSRFVQLVESQISKRYMREAVHTVKSVFSKPRDDLVGCPREQRLGEHSFARVGGVVDWVHCAQEETMRAIRKSANVVGLEALLFA